MYSIYKEECFRYYILCFHSNELFGKVSNLEIHDFFIQNLLLKMKAAIKKIFFFFFNIHKTTW